MTDRTTEVAAKRQRLIKVIHVARRELDMDEATYRQILRTAGQAESTSAMQMPALQAVLDHFKRCGFKVKAKSGDRRQAATKDARKVRALWLFLHELGAVRDPSEAALAAYVKRIAKVDDLAWARGDDLTTLIETLKKWAMRYLPDAITKLQAEAMAAHQAGRLGPVQLERWKAAALSLQRGQGFDMHWWAWEFMQECLGRLVTPAIKSIGETDEK